MTTTRYQHLLGAVFLMALNASAADTVSFNFASSTGTTVASASNPIGAAETAGATGYNFTNWNNLLSDWGGNAGAIPNPILDSNGATVTGMTIGYDSPNAWNNAIATTTGDLKLMRNYLDSGVPDSPSVQITAAPYRKFDLVVYADGDGGAGQTLGPYVVRYNNTGTQFASQTEAATNVGNLLRAPVWLKETGNFSGTYTLVDTAASLSVAAAQSGNYMVFSGLKGTVNLDPTQTTSVSRAPLNGFQIVKWETANTIPGADDPAARIALYTGEVTVAANRTIGSLATSVGTYGDLVINPGVTLTLANGDLDLGDINHWVKGGGSVTPGGSTLTINRDISAGFSYLANSTDVAVNGATIVDNGGGAVGVRKTGGGKLRLQSANTYTGATTISQGSIEVGNGNGLGASTAAVTLNDAGTSFFSTALYVRTGVTLSRNIMVANLGAASSTSTLGSLEAGTGTFSGTVTLDKSAGMDIAAGSAVTFSGVISGVGGLTKVGAGTASLSGGNTYTGATTVNGGTLDLGGGAARTSASFTVNPGATLSLNGTNLFVAGHGVPLVASRVITVNNGTLLMPATTNTRIGNVVLNNGSTWTSDRVLTDYDALLADTDGGAATVSVTGSGASVMNGSGGLHLQGVQNFNVADVTASTATDMTVSMQLAGPGTTGGAAGGINKTGAGTMVLSGNNTYNGATTVSAGTLLVNGTHTGGGLITVSAGATLGGIGNVGAVTVADNGILSPGNSAGNFTVSSLTLNAASVLNFELDAPSLVYNPASDFATVGGALTLRGVLNVSPMAGFGTPAGGEKWLIMSYAGPLADNGLTMGAAPTLAGGLFYQIDTTIANQVFLTVVPEAGSGALAVLGLLLLLRRR